MTTSPNAMPPNAAPPTAAPVAVKVWDPVVRLFHWSLVVCVLLNATVIEDESRAHEWVGYTAAGLVVLRLLWGVVGTRHARYADWFPTPSRVRTHVRALLAGELPHHTGHNPLGALMMLGLMALVLALGATGWLMGAETLSAGHGAQEMLEEVHEVLSALLLAAAGLHAAAALVMGHLEGVNLVQAMVTGVKRYRG